MQVLASLRLWPFWWLYSIQDVKNRYARSVIGPFWITISIAVTIVAMGPLYSAMFSVNGSAYYYHIASGLVFWSFIASYLTEACSGFMSHEAFIKQTNYPSFVYILRVMSRNLIILFHNLFIVMIAAVYNHELTIWWLMFPFALGLVIFVLLPAGWILAAATARYRDILPLITSLLQLLMFLTPVFWVQSGSTVTSTYLIWNPMFYILEILRASWSNQPLFGLAHKIFLMGFVLWLIAFYLFKKIGRRISTWL